MSKPLEDLYMLRHQLHQNSHIAETCRFFRWLSGKSVHAYAKAIGVSHTYWRELENGIKQNPSSKVKKSITEVSGLHYSTVELLFENQSINFEDVYAFIISALNSYLEELSQKKIKIS